MGGCRTADPHCLKILILKPSSLGDVVQALPVLRCLKRHLPQSRIYWWIETGLAPLLENDPDLEGIVRFNRRGWAAPANWTKLGRDIAWLRNQRFDWVIDLQSLARSAMFAWIANGALLVGLDEVREAARGFYDLVARRKTFHTHAVDWYLEVLPLLGVPVRRDLEWLPMRPLAAQAVRRAAGTETGAWIVIQPGARWLNKRWPVEHYRDLVRRLADWRSDLRFAILGGGDDEPLGRIIGEAAPGRSLDLTGRISLPEMIEWIRLCQVMVTNDTGPMHVAAALGKPVVGLFGPTEPHRTGPYGQTQQVLRLDLPCVPCMSSRCRHKPAMECLTQITPERVFSAVQRRFGACHPKTAH